MKNTLLILLLLPFVTFGQVTSKKKVVHKTVQQPAKPVDEFSINGYITGFPDGTVAAILNPQSGVAEASTTIAQNKFLLKGKMPSPDFRVLLFNNRPPYITLLLDNSDIKITGTKDSLGDVQIKGSPLQTDFQTFNNQIAPYQYLFADDAIYDSTAISNAMLICNNFATQHSTSFAATLAVIRFMQIADDNNKTEALYNQLSPNVQASTYGQYIIQQISDAKKNGVGTLLPDFTQTDTAGNPISLSSFRGKYVLVDFWASWCRPCRNENPNVVAAYNEFKNKNFTILSVSLDQAKDAWVNAIKMDNLTWTHVSDLHGWANAVAQQFQINQIPQNILIGPDGKVLAKNLRGPALERKLNRVLR